MTRLLLNGAMFGEKTLQHYETLSHSLSLPSMSTKSAVFFGITDGWGPLTQLRRQPEPMTQQPAGSEGLLPGATFPWRKAKNALLLHQSQIVSNSLLRHPMLASRSQLHFSMIGFDFLLCVA